jgi:ABC-type antimicrobial peptide transport system permease subunit
MLYLRASGDEAGLASRVRAELLALEPRLRYVDVDPLADMTATETRSWRLGASMFTVFGVLALIVASIGLYSVLAFDVAQRTRELGLRSALGAGATRLLGDVVLRAMRMTVAGLAIGIVAALLFAPRLSGVLFETSPRDPLTHAGVAVTLLIVAVISSGLPALRASRVDPNIALRSD